MPVFMIQCKYEQTKTWYVEADSEEQAKEAYESADLEMEHDPSIETSHGNLQAVVRVDGPISTAIQEKMVRLNEPFDFEREQ